MFLHRTKASEIYGSLGGNGNEIPQSTNLPRTLSDQFQPTIIAVIPTGGRGNRPLNLFGYPERLQRTMY